MSPETIQKLNNIAKAEMEKRGNDISHDYNHACNVLYNCEQIMVVEGGDMEVIVPAALFHDVVIYPKNHPKSDQAPHESAVLVETILSKVAQYPSEKVLHVKEIIGNCSFHKTDTPPTLEGKILCDADKLAATGAIAIMRTFASSDR